MEPWVFWVEFCAFVQFFNCAIEFLFLHASPSQPAPGDHVVPFGLVGNRLQLQYRLLAVVGKPQAHFRDQGSPLRLRKFLSTAADILWQGYAAQLNSRRTARRLRQRMKMFLHRLLELSRRHPIRLLNRLLDRKLLILD